MSFPNKRRFEESAISFETNTTTQQNKEKNIKITLNAPKKDNPSDGIGRGDSFKEKEEVLADSKRRNSEVVTNVNRMVKGQGMTFTNFLKGQEERNSVKQQHIGNSTVVTLPYSLKSSSNLGRSQVTSSSFSSNVFAPLASPKTENIESLGKTSYFRQEKEMNALKNAHINHAPSNGNDNNNSNDPKVVHLSCEDSDSISEVLEMIDIDNTREDPIVDNDSPVFGVKDNKTDTITQNVKMSVRPTLIQTTQRGDSKSNSKMKLRDYLYMVEAKSKHSTKKPTPQDLPPTPTSKQVAPSIPTLKDSRLQRSSVTSRKDGQKYSISNAMMFDILKKEIHDDISHVMHSLRRLDEELLSVQPRTDQPPNEDLLVLYSVRRQIKQEMHKKLEAAIQSIKTHKKSRIEPAPRTQRQRKRSHV